MDKTPTLIQSKVDLPGINPKLINAKFSLNIPRTTELSIKRSRSFAEDVKNMSTLTAVTGKLFTIGIIGRFKGLIGV